MRRIIQFIVIAAVFGLGASAFAAEKEKKETVLKTISSRDAYKLIQAEKGNTNFLLLDIRTSDEFKMSHINGAVNIDFYAENFRDQLDQLVKTKKILIYCRTGNRSGKTLPVMSELGFREVYNMAGGIKDWELNGYEVVQ